MKFDYLQRVIIDAQLDVENIGECVLLGRNDLGEEWYLLIHTDMGFTEVIEHGPVVPDLSILPFSISTYYNRFEYNQGKIERIIDKFLNNPKRGISQAEVSTLEYVEEHFPNIVKRVYKTYVEEVN